MDEWLVAYWPAPVHRDEPDAYMLVHVSLDREAVVLRSRVTHALWCRACQKSSRDGCDHTRAVVAWVQERRAA